MSQDKIDIRGARENNLKDISVRIPKRQITIFTGVSGSGKSSLVFDTIAAEARRQLNETFSTFVRNFLPRYAQPEADAIDNLSMAIVVDQKRLGGGSHSTVGTITDIYSVLRLLYSRFGQPYAGSALAFSFNDPRHVSAVQWYESQRTIPNRYGRNLSTTRITPGTRHGAIKGCRTSSGGRRDG